MAGNEEPAAKPHQTINRVTRILEEVVYRPGSSYMEITRALGAPKSSVYGFIRGLLAADWLIEQDYRLYLGPAFYSLTIATGHIRAGMVTHADLDGLYRETGLIASVGVRAGDHLIYVAEAGRDVIAAFEARSNIRRNLLTTAGGKALLAFMPENELETYLRRRAPEEKGDVEAFLQACATIRENAVAVNVNDKRARTGVGTVITDSEGRVVASLTVAGPTSQVLPQVDKLSALLRSRVAEWHARSSASAREPI